MIHWNREYPADGTPNAASHHGVDEIYIATGFSTLGHPRDSCSPQGYVRV